MTEQSTVGLFRRLTPLIRFVANPAIRLAPQSLKDVVMPADLKKSFIRADVVVLPLVPVTAIVSLGLEMILRKSGQILQARRPGISVLGFFLR